MLSQKSRLRISARRSNSSTLMSDHRTACESDQSVTQFSRSVSPAQTPSASSPIAIAYAPYRPFAVNSYIVENGIERQLVVYWYQQSGGRIVTNEYLGRVYLVVDSLTRNRSDAALIRVSVPFEGDAATAEDTARAFLQVAYPTLMQFLPHDAPTSDARRQSH